MIPDDIQSFKTPGEERFYRFLSAVAKPDERYVAWYLPDVNGREPDFILFSRAVGLVIFEVKDWELSQIVEADPHGFSIIVGGIVETRKNPLQQARDYFEEVLDKIKDDGSLVSKDPHHFGNPRIPISYGVVFPNINKYEL